MFIEEKFWDISFDALDNFVLTKKTFLSCGAYLLCFLIASSETGTNPQ